jgi:hypothetical protein
MTRKRGMITPEMFEKVIVEGHALGAREVGLYSGGEPMLCAKLEDYIRQAKEVGYQYVYMSTNGTACNEARLVQIIEAGLDSIKFSINAGERVTYQNIHGKDHFDRVKRRVKFISNYRKKEGTQLKLFISFVECDENQHTLMLLKKEFGAYVDDIHVLKAGNQMGQMPQYSTREETGKPCPLPFNRIHVSREGYLRGCCNDYQNALAMEDLKNMSLKEAWHSYRFQEFRKRMISGSIGGILCHNCLHGTRYKVVPLNPDLAENDMF